MHQYSSRNNIYKGSYFVVEVRNCETELSMYMQSLHHMCGIYGIQIMKKIGFVFSSFFLTYTLSALLLLTSTNSLVFGFFSPLIQNCIQVVPPPPSPTISSANIILGCSRKVINGTCICSYEGYNISIVKQFYIEQLYYNNHKHVIYW